MYTAANQQEQESLQKGIISGRLEARLDQKYNDACKRARKLTLHENPSTNMYLFIKELEKAKKEKLK